MKLFESNEKGGCCGSSQTADAKRVCDALDIPHYTINFKKDFNKYVIDDFIQSYKNCKTPNPCIECNKYLKFGAMYKKALELDCDYIATGHYAKVEYDEHYKKNVLKKANAIAKDQTYFLYSIPSYILDKVIFPLGNFSSKDEIREIARKNNLLVANKPDSEDVCFIPDGNYKKFLEENSNIKSKPGKIKNKSGEVLGTHTGLYKYTIGQRKGLGISNTTPLYVTNFNKDKNALFVGDEKELYSKEFFVSDINLLLFDKLDEPLDVDVKTRYSVKSHKATIYQEDNDTIKVIFKEPQRAITKGQSAVFYINDIVVGGGKII